MVRIHGSIWIVLGILMSLYSRFIQSQIEKGSMSLFFWVGIGFIAFGVFRLITDYVFKDSSKISKPVSGNSSLDRLKLEKERMMQKKDDYEQSYDNSGKVIIPCSRCGTKHYGTSNFCHICGFQLK
jgi:hypothetical protein